MFVLSAVQFLALCIMEQHYSQKYIVVKIQDRYLREQTVLGFMFKIRRITVLKIDTEDRVDKERNSI